MMTEKRMNEFLAAVVKMRGAASDDSALEAVAIYPDWNGNGVAYTTGERVIDNEVLYKVLQSHTSQPDWMPHVAPSLFTKVLTSDTDEILPWEQPESTNPYMTGDKVTHNDKTWVSIVDNNVWEPGVYGWEEIIL